MRAAPGRSVVALALLLPLALAVAPGVACGELLALASLAPVAPTPAADADLDVRARFEATMTAILADLPDAIVTSRMRTEADQQRIAALGYKPHRHSQHKRGLAWDCAAPLATLETIRDRARAEGLTAVIMTSPVTGVAYIHVQRYPRRQAPPALEAPADTAVAVAEPTPAPAPAPEEVLTADEAAEEVALAPFDGPRPKPIGVERLELPRELRKKKASGRIVLLVRLDPAGKVLDLAVDSSDLPDFEPFVVSEVRQWRFSPPTRQGQPVEAYARLPIPIHVD